MWGKWRHFVIIIYLKHVSLVKQESLKLALLQ